MGSGSDFGAVVMRKSKWLVQRLAGRVDNQDTAKGIWLAAYKKLQEEEGTKEMVKTYETLLSKQLDSKLVQTGESTPSSLSSYHTPEEKIAGMRRVTEVTLEKSSLHTDRKQGFVKAAKVLNTIGSAVVKPMLQTEAVASLAVSAQ
ncbi:hypothetical protein SLS63_013710 [Diaporthe eres]|uniref:NWD NACHT-NTPase N-terminal domain-containing protein n=1 Tax=Diaporthe eres TaxID=83184 RepID=A0ABR1NMQ0_DIAER